jgi:acid phosphatase type 7
MADIAQAELIRGPYLQQGTAQGIIVCWRNGDAATTNVVRYGLSPSALTQTAVGLAGINAEVQITGLTPETRYCYEIVSDGNVLATGSDYHFRTHIPVGSAKPFRFWVLGDCGTGSVNAAAVRDSFAPIHAARPADFWLMLGDNAYGSGTDSQFQTAVFNLYHPWLQQLPLWSCLGNHETYGGEVDGQFAYERIHVFPTAGECGGVASGTERYYSWNHGNVHFISIDSMTASRAPTGAMSEWLRLDLAANLQPWVIACWHHPPYTRGSHNSDYEGDLVEIRETIVPLLENAGIDLVLNGHSHSYERTGLIDGHYGLSDSYDPEAHEKQGDLGREDTPGGPYRKGTYGTAPNEGTVYVVAGSSGQSSGGQLDHPAMKVSLANLGSLVIDVSDYRMDVRFLREQGAPTVYGDSFALIKGGALAPSAPSPMVQLATGPTSAIIHWGDSGPSETAYEISVKIGDETIVGPLILPVDTTSYALSEIAVGATIEVTVRASNPVGFSPPAEMTFVHAAPASPPTSVERWRFAHWGNPADVGRGANDHDADADGYPNLVEYGLGTQPNYSYSQPLVHASRTPSGNLALTFPRQALPDVTYTVEFSPNLTSGSWTSAFTSSGIANTAAPVSVPDPATGARRFGRVRIQL